MTESTGTTGTSGLAIVKKSLRRLSLLLELVNKQLDNFATSLDWLILPTTKEDPKEHSNESPEVSRLSQLTGGHPGMAVVVISSVVTFALFMVATCVFLKWRRHWKERTSVQSETLHANQNTCAAANIACQLTTADDTEVCSTESKETQPSASEQANVSIAQATSPDITSNKTKPQLTTNHSANPTLSAQGVTETSSDDPSSHNKDILDTQATEVVSENSLGKQNNCNIKDPSHGKGNATTSAIENIFFVSASQKDSPKKLKNHGCTHKRITKRAQHINNILSDRISRKFYLKRADTFVLSSKKGEGAFRGYSKTNWAASPVDATVPQYHKSNGALGEGECEETDEIDALEDVEPERCKREGFGFETFQEPVCLQYSQKRAYDLGNVGRHNTKYLAEGGQTSSNEFSSYSKEVMDTDATEAFYEHPLGKPNNTARKGDDIKHLDNNGILDCVYFSRDNKDKSHAEAVVIKYSSSKQTPSNQLGYKPYQQSYTENQMLDTQNVNPRVANCKNRAQGISNDGVVFSQNALKRQTETKKREQFKASGENLYTFTPRNEIDLRFTDLRQASSANETECFRHLENDSDLKIQHSHLDQLRFMEQVKGVKIDLAGGTHLVQKQGQDDKPLDERFQSKYHYPAVHYNNVHGQRRPVGKGHVEREYDSKCSANSQTKVSMQMNNLNKKNLSQKMSKVQHIKSKYQQPCIGSVQGRKHAHARRDIKRFNIDPSESIRDTFEKGLTYWQYTKKPGISQVENGNGSYNYKDNVSEEKPTYWHINGHYKPLCCFQAAGDIRKNKTTSGGPVSVQCNLRNDHYTPKFTNHVKHNDDAQEQPAIRVPTSSNLQVDFGHMFSLPPGRANQFTGQTSEPHVERFEATNQSNGDKSAYESRYLGVTPENNRPTLTDERWLKYKKGDQEYLEIDSISKGRKCYHEVIKKPRSLISVRNMLTKLASNPAVKFLKRQEDTPEAVKPKQWVYQYPEQSQLGSASYSIAQPEMMSNKVADKYGKCNKSKKVKRHRPSPYQKQRFISSDNPTFIRHDGVYIRNKNNCSPSRRGRFITAPKVDLQHFNQDLLPKVGRKLNRPRTVESVEAMFLKPATCDRATQRSKSFSENDQCHPFTPSESEGYQNELFKPARGTLGKVQPFKNNFFSLDRKMLGDPAKEKHLFKNTETSDTLTRSDAQNSFSAMENFMYPINAPTTPKHLASPQESIARQTDFTHTEECNFDLRQGCVANQTMHLMTQSQITLTDGALQVATVDVQTSHHNEERFTETIFMSMTQNHTTQTDALVLTTNVDVQTSPHLEENSTIVHHPLTDAGVQTSPQYESSTKGTTSNHNTFLCDFGKRSKNLVKKPKFVRDRFSRGSQNTFVFKRNSSADGAMKPKSFSVPVTTGTTREATHYWNVPEIKDLRDSNGERAPWLHETAQTKEEGDVCDIHGAENDSWKNNATRKCDEEEKTKEPREIFQFGSRNSENCLHTNLKKVDRSTELLKPPTESFVAPDMKVETAQARRFLPTPALHLESQAEEVSEASLVSSKISELKSLCVSRPAWKNVNVDEIDRRVKWALKRREELQKQKSSTIQANLKLSASDKVSETYNLVKSDERAIEIQNATTVCPKESSAQTSQPEPFQHSEANQFESGSSEKPFNTISKRDNSPSEQRSKVAMLVAPRDPSCSLSSDDENDSNESENSTEQTNSYKDNLVISSQTNNVEQKTLKRARAKGLNSPPTKISKVENAQAKQVKLVGQLVSCLPQVPLASLIEWFIETSDPSSYVSSDHSSECSCTEDPLTPSWFSQDDGDSVVSSEVSTSRSGLTETRIDSSSSFIQTPTAQLAYEDYSDGEPPSSTGEEDTVQTCTADLSVFLDGYGDSDAKKGATALASPMTKAAAAGTKTNDCTSCAAPHGDTGDKRSEDDDDDDRCASGREHVFMNFRKTTDSREVARFDRTRIRLKKSSDLKGIITKVQKDDS